MLEYVFAQATTAVVLLWRMGLHIIWPGPKTPSLRLLPIQSLRLSCRGMVLLISALTWNIV